MFKIHHWLIARWKDSSKEKVASNRHYDIKLSKVSIQMEISRRRCRLIQQWKVSHWANCEVTHKQSDSIGYSHCLINQLAVDGSFCPEALKWILISWICHKKLCGPITAAARLLSRWSGMVFSLLRLRDACIGTPARSHYAAQPETGWKRALLYNPVYGCSSCLAYVIIITIY